MTMRRAMTGWVLAAWVWGAASAAAAPPPLELESRIPLGAVKGRIDHMAADVGRRRLFVAELGNGSVSVVDLAAGKVLRRLTGFSEPQGIGYEPSTDSLFISNAGDGAVRIFRGEDFSPLGAIDLGDDADNVRIDRSANRVYVGYGSGALAVIDPATRTQIGKIPLRQHPEGFQLDPAGPRIFVNVPRSTEIAVVDREARRQTATWSRADGFGNFPMQFDPANRQVVSVYRFPARLRVFDAATGKLLQSEPTCGDSDDVFLDVKRQRLYLSCGEGGIEVFERVDGAYRPLSRIRTVSGARTSLYVPDLDRLYVAVRAHGSEPAAIWIFRPAP